MIAGAVYFYNTNWFQSFFMYGKYYQDIVNVPFDVTKTGATISIPLKHAYNTCYSLAIGVPDSKLAHRGFEGNGVLAYRFISKKKILAEGITAQPKRRSLKGEVTYINLLVFDLPFPGAENDLTLELTVQEPMEFLTGFKGDLTCRVRPNYSSKAGKCYDEDLRIEY
jgi:hypothetical protein